MAFQPMLGLHIWHMAYADWSFLWHLTTCFPFLAYDLISGIYDMTYDTSRTVVCLYVTCITIIDTVILNIHTNNAYIFDTHDTSRAGAQPSDLPIKPPSSILQCLLNPLLLYLYMTPTYTLFKPIYTYRCAARPSSGSVQAS
jgi:hypothetical protein